MSVDDEFEAVHYYGHRDWLERLALTVYRDGVEPVGYVLGLQIYDAARSQLLDDRASEPYVEVLERVLSGDAPMWD